MGNFSSKNAGGIARLKSFVRLTFFLPLLFLLSAISTVAQGSYIDEPGIPAFTTSFPVEHGFINLANGNLHLEIPVATYPQRGNIKALHARLVYDSRLWTIRTDPVTEAQRWQLTFPAAGIPLASGWRFITDGEQGATSVSQSSQYCGSVNFGSGKVDYYKTTYSDYTYTEPNGTKHTTAFNFKLYNRPGVCVGGALYPTGTAYAADNSGYKFVITNGLIAVYAPDGTQVATPPPSGSQGIPPGGAEVQDTNGNFFTYAPGQYNTFVNVVDTLGRTPVITTFSSSDNQAFLDYLCEQGCNPAGGDRARITLNFSPLQYATQFNQTQPEGVGEYSGAGNALTSIVLPDGSSYQFQYDSYAQITSMTLPTGGQVTYTYNNFADYTGYNSRWVTSKTADGNTWTFAPTLPSCSTQPCPNQLTVTTPPYNDGTTTASDSHVYTFAVDGRQALNTQTQVFRGSPSGAPFLTKTTDYSAFDQPIRETLIWPNGLSNKVEYTYDGYSNITATKEWDYGNTSSAPDRETDTAYITDAAYANANIIRLPKTVTSLNGSGAQVAQTTFNYDEGTPVASNISAQHGAVSGPRGNLTSVAKWLSSSNSTVTTASTTWFDTGMVNVTKDALQNATTFTYDATGAYAIKKCDALSHCSYAAFDPNTGVPVSTTNTNGSGPGDPAHTTTYTFDSMLRPLCTNLPDGGQTCLSYPSTTSTQKTTKITSGLSDTTITVFDGYGRVSQAQHVLPQGTAKADTTYDSMGRLASVSNPYFSTSEPTYGVTRTLYDALGRAVQTTKQDGSTSTVSYSANCTTTTDEAGKQRKNCHNGFGEIVEVDEPNAASPATNATASVAIGGSLGSVLAGSAPTAPSGTNLVMAQPNDLYFQGSNGHIYELYNFSSAASPADWHTFDITAYTGAPNWGGNTLAAFYDSSRGITNVFYESAGDQHIRHFWCCQSGSWVADDTTALAAFAVTGAANTPLVMAGNNDFYYLGSNGHVQSLHNYSGGNSSGTWGVYDLEGNVGGPPFSGTTLAAYVDAAHGLTNILYEGNDQHIHDFWCCRSGSFVQDDLTNIAAGGVAGAANTPIFLSQTNDLYYIASSLGARELYNWSGAISQGTWNNNDITGLSGTPVSSGSTFFAYFDRTSWVTNVLYESSDQHLRHVWCCTASGWTADDLTGLAGANPAVNTPLVMASLNDLYYLGSDQHVYELYNWSSGNTPGGWHRNDLNGITGGAAFSGNTLFTYKDASGLTNVFYESSDQHLRHFWCCQSGTWVADDVSAATVTAYDSGTVSLNVGGFTATVCFGNSTNTACSGKPVNRTASDVANALAAIINGAGSPATATVSGSTINMIWKTPGAQTPSIAALTTTHDNASLFSNPSFTSPATNFAGGYNAGDVRDNPLVTLYTYDALGNLMSVTQKGDPTVTSSSQWRVRNFTYDSFSRLLTATNPESGAISYFYDNNGNLLQKVMPTPNQTGTAQHTISFCYDQLNRVTGKAYSWQNCTSSQLPAGTAVVTYAYDSGTNGLGRLTSLTDQAGSGSYSYSALGRLSNETRTINGVTKKLSYSYNLDGSLKSVTYPSGATVTYTPDSAGQVLSAVDTGNNINYVTGATYNAGGVLTGFVSGYSSNFAGITNTFSFNNRLQPVNMSAATPSATVFSLNYDFHLGNGDNGNVFGITNNKDTTRNQTFAYDLLNRLTSAQNAGTDCTQNTLNGKTKFWGNSYSYDAWGNLLTKTPTNCSAEGLSLVSNIQNRADNGLPQVQNYQYDAAGNLTKDLSNGGVNYTYDQENRITGAAGYTYIYDVDGNRVQKSTGTVYWHMTPGVVAESDLAGNLQSEYVFFGGERVARKDFPSSNITYYFSDDLKTASVITDATGNIKSESDYYPWGGELQFANSDSNHYKFTGKERDSETGLDYFGARYYASPLGRFVSSDPLLTTLRPENPQTLNRYAYTLNNPLKYIDPNGLYEEEVHRDLTIVLARAAGFSETTATAIGAADQGVDDSSTTGPFAGEDARRDYHFTTDNRRKDLYYAFDSSGSVNDLGVYLHAEQDSFSHAGYGPKTGHLLAGHAPDKTYNDPDKADKMAQDTYNVLVSAATNLGVNNGRVSWQKIDKLVGEFNRAKTKDEKDKILKKIRDVIKEDQENANRNKRKNPQHTKFGATID